MSKTRFERAVESLTDYRVCETLAPMFGAIACLLFIGIYVVGIGVFHDRMSTDLISKQLSFGRNFGGPGLMDISSRTVDEFSARSTWAVSAMIYLFSMFLVMGVAGTILVSSYVRSHRFSYLSIGAHLCALPLAVANIVLVYNSGTVRGNFGGELFDALGTRTHSHVDLMTSIGNVLTGFSLTLIPLSAFQELEECHKARFGPDRIARLRKGCERLRALFYVSCAMLASGTVEVWSLMTWPATHFGGALHDDLLAFSRVFASLVGATFTAYLAVVFLPTAFVIRRLSGRLGAVADPDMSPAKAQAWALRNGLTPSVSGKIINVLAALAPLVLGGAIGEILSAVSKRL